MSTRAVYTFKDEYGEHHVYKHCDGYPAGAARWIEAALTKAWPLPRFEADDFAAAFVAANHERPGDTRLTTGPQAHGDLAFNYIITKRDGALWIECPGDFEGTLPDMLAKYPKNWS
jgi:hypothetical protein